MPDAEFTGKTTIARYARSIDAMAPADRKHRLQRSCIVRASFIADGCHLLPGQPDRMHTP